MQVIALQSARRIIITTISIK